MRKKQGLLILLPVLICLVSVTGISAFWLYEYRQAAFESISRFCKIMAEDHPETEEMVISEVKAYLAYSEMEAGENGFLTQYGYRSAEFYEGIRPDFILLSIALFLVPVSAFGLLIWYLNRRNRMRIAELTEYLEQVNIGASGTIIQRSEDEFSHLQDEIYKTVTALYQTKDAAVKAKENFADNLTNIAHQLKTPVTASFLSLQLIEKTNPGHYVKQIKMQLERLNRLEESLLILSRIDAGVLQMEVSQVDVYTALSLAAENLNDLLAKEKISVTIPEKESVAIRGDLEWTMEAFINLIKNCMEHSPEGGTIHCDYSQNPLYVEIIIWDEGEGFEAEDIPHLFERFYRGKNADGNGIGIGLALARSVFELQNGNITARNLPGGGACFEIRVYGH